MQELALKKPPQAHWPYALIMDQIKARQKLITKVPIANKENMIYPPSDLVEQASSWACALYKASLSQGKTFADLTAGSGTDSFAFAQNFQNGILIEQDETSAGILAHNIKALEIESLNVKNQSAEEFVQNMSDVDLAFIDPQRRNDKRRGIYDLADCSPNIIELLPNIKAKTIILKTSPVLDIKKTISDLTGVTEVHVVEYDGDCKELLFVMSKENSAETEPLIHTVQLHSDGSVKNSLKFTFEDEQNAASEYASPNAYLYEPSPAFQKSGAYNSIAKEYGLYKLHPNTHLYTSAHIVESFPGRGFKILEQTQANHKALKAILPDMKANLTIRNFPMKIEDLKKKLKIKDGGGTTIFACTNDKEEKILLKCEKI